MLNEIRELLRLAPFQPFTIYLSDGRKFKITHPEAMWITPRGGVYVAHSDSDSDSDVVERFNALLLSSAPSLDFGIEAA